MQKDPDTKAKLQKDLLDLVKDIDEEGLLILIEQANVIKYNMTVDKINKEKAKLGTVNDGKDEDEEDEKMIRIIPGEQNKSFIIQLYSIKAFLSREDFKGLVKVCQSKDSIDEVAKRVFNWLMKERKDILIDSKITRPGGPELRELVNVIKAKYKVDD
jgi:hypothetical protein